MNKNYTLKELADIGAKAANSCLPEGVRMCVLSGSPPHHVVARQAFTKAILDTIGYEFPVDAEREAFAKWWATSNLQTFCNAEDAFKAWKAGREELRKEVCSDQCEDNSAMFFVGGTWIPWYGGDKSPIVGEQTRYEVECRSGARNIWNTNFLRWSHDGSLGDIMAYRIILD